MKGSTFNKYFKVKKKALDKEGFFNISLISDLPLFIDPFHLFYSPKKEYRNLHNEIIKYLVFLKELSVANGVSEPSRGQIEAYYKFPEVRQNWFGFTLVGNRGHGLGPKFAKQLNANFHSLFSDFGATTAPRHLEKLTLVADRVGRDTISDFTTNLIHAFLAEKTQKFAKKHIGKEKLKKYTIPKAEFDYARKAWKPKTFLLPSFDGDYVLLTPRDLLTKHDTWINKENFIKDFSSIPNATSDAALRELLINYFNAKLAEYSEEVVNKKTGKKERKTTAKSRKLAALDTAAAYPVTIDIYIHRKEKRGEEAKKQSEELVSETEQFHETQFVDFVEKIDITPKKPTSYEEAHSRAIYFKKCIEEHELYKNLYIGDVPADEDWIQRMFRFVWYGAQSSVDREPKTGGGKPDYSISQGAKDKSLVEFKLASSSTLEDNLLNQLEKYKKAEDTNKGLWIVVYFDGKERQKILSLLEKHKLQDSPNHILIDARKDKTPPSKIKSPR